MDTLTIKEWHLTDFTITIKDETWTPLDITGYDGIRFIMIDETNTVIIDQPATITDASNWIITYNFVTWDTDTKGTYKAYFSLTQAGVKKLAVPTDYFTVEITEDFID